MRYAITICLVLTALLMYSTGVGLLVLLGCLCELVAWKRIVKRRHA